ncbi:MAG: hypothetical protein IJN53_06890 [Oscillospiraceae bacterium]|nr:hypothetical protein [Oscillospiraceae bacterium]
MELHLSKKEFRRLLDLVYMGNWVLNSTRMDRFADYDAVESKLFELCLHEDMQELAVKENGVAYPSRAYMDGGIHEAINAYEDTVFYEILAEELSRRDMDYPEITEENYDEMLGRMNGYMQEFHHSGVDRLVLDDSQ